MAPAPLPVPALFPPGDGANHTWPAPNFVNPETRSWTAPVCIMILFIISSVVFAARIWARFRITGTRGLDDWLIIASMPGLLGLTLSTVLGLRVYGFQLHIYDQTPRTNITIRQITLAMETIYLGTTTLTKISILTFYRRIASSLISRPIMIFIWASIIFVAAYGISSISVIIFTCWPVEAYWYRFSTWWLETHTYKCHDELTTLVVVISISTAQDFIACILPIFAIRKLRLPRRQKWALAAVFGMGFLTCATGALRVHYAHRVYHYVHSGSLTYDISWEAFGAWIATAVEANLAVICASAPALKVYCSCFDSTRQEVRSFGWYNDRSRPISASTCWSKGEGSVRLKKLFCCFIEDASDRSCGKRTGASNKTNDSGMALGSRTIFEREDEPQYCEFNSGRRKAGSPEDIELQSRDQQMRRDRTPLAMNQPDQVQLLRQS